MDLVDQCSVCIFLKILLQIALDLHVVYASFKKMHYLDIYILCSQTSYWLL